MYIKNKYLSVFSFVVLSYCLSISAWAENSSTAQVDNKIEKLSTGLQADKQKTTQLKDEVEVLEKKVGEITRKAYSTEKKVKQIEKKLKRFARKRKELAAVLDNQKKGLAQQLQAYYSAGEQSHLRLLLRQDNPSSIGRTVKYFEYLNKSRLNKITKVKKTLADIDTIEREGLENKKKLQALITTLNTQKKASKRLLSKREAVYKQSQKNVSSKDKQLKQLKRKEAGLQAKIDGLVAKSDTKKTASNKNKQNQADKTEKATGRVVETSRYIDSNKSFNTLRGKLSWPVKGRIIHGYNSRRNKQQRWKGSVIAASGGSRVRAIASGEVEFAGWFNGYGYLVIIRHDKRYRSLYGYNRAVHVNVGQRVTAGTTIASVGNSGGQQRNALYFEIRKQTQPQNPSKWCR